MTGKSESAMRFHDTYDVLVAGGGPSGLIAAVAAARSGARTALIESHGFLGGTATAGMVAQIYGFFYGTERRIVGGLPFEFVQRLEQSGASTGFYDYTMAELTDFAVVARTLPFDPELYKCIADDFAQSAGVHLQYHTSVIDTIVDEDGRVAGGVTASNEGVRRLSAAVTIDCTGDGVVALRAGCSELPSDEVQPMTLCFRMGNVDLARYKALSREEKRRLVQRGLAEGRLFWQGMSVTPTPNAGEVLSLTSRVLNRSSRSAADVTAAEIEGRKQVRLTIDFLRENVPGFENARLVAIAPHIGIRETRRIRGVAMLDDDTVLRGMIPADTVALGGGPVDIHEAGGAAFKELRLPEGGPFGIPYGALIPAERSGLLVAGRCLSATRAAYSAVRHMGNCMAMGHAAGVAAALSIQRNLPPHQLPVAMLQEALQQQGAYLS